VALYVLLITAPFVLILLASILFVNALTHYTVVIIRTRQLP